MRIGLDVSPLARAHSPGLARAVGGLADALEARARVQIVRLAPEPGENLRAWRHGRLPQLARELGLDGLHACVSAFPLRARVPCVHTVHELPWRHGVRENAGLRHRAWVRLGAWRAARTVTASEHVARELRRGWRATRVRVVPWGVGAPFGEFPPPGAVDEMLLGRLRLGQDALALCPGATRAKKGLAELLHGLAALVARRGPRFQVVVTGPDTPDLRRDLGLAARLGLNRYVSTPGALSDDDLAALYRLATVVPVLSRSEGFALPVLEAMASGTPVIVPRDTAQAELAGSAGLEVDAGDPEKVADALASAHARRQELRGALLARAAEFPWERSAAAFEALWEASVSAPRVLVSGLVLDQPMGGVQRHNRELLPRAARLLAADGGRLALLAPARGLAFALDETVLVLPSRLPSQPALVRATLERAGLLRALAAARARGEPFDVVHTAHLPLPRGLRVPVSLLVHDLKHQQGGLVGPARRALGDSVVARALREAGAVLAVSEALRAELLRLAPLDPERVEVLPNAADHLCPLPRRPADDAPIVHVGHIEPRKNLALLVRALAHDPGLPRLVLAGAPRGAEDVRLRDLALELGVSARLQFVGLLDDRELCELYATAACAVFPSLREGFGIPALEAQLALVPVAISHSAALREVAGPDAPGFAPDDARACARAIRAALARPPEELEAARARAASVTWDASAARLVARWSALAQRA